MVKEENRSNWFIIFFIGVLKAVKKESDISHCLWLVKPCEQFTHCWLDHLLSTGSEWFGKCLAVHWYSNINIGIVLPLFSLTLTQLDVWPWITPCTWTHWVVSHYKWMLSSSPALLLLMHSYDCILFQRDFFSKLFFVCFNFKQTILLF